MELVAAGRDLGEIHDLVDDLQKVGPALADQAGIFADLIGGKPVGHRRHQVGKAQYGIQRRLELVAHGAQQCGLGAVGACRRLVQPARQVGQIVALAPGLGTRTFQRIFLFGQRGLGAHLVGDVGKDHRTAAIGRGAVAHQPGPAVIRLHRHMAGRLGVDHHPALHPDLRIGFQHGAAGKRHHCHHLPERASGQGVQLHADKAGIKRVGHDKPVVAVVEGEGVGRQCHRFLQPGELGACLGDVTPQKDGVAARGTAGLDLHHPPAGKVDVARKEISRLELGQAGGDEGIDAAGKHGRRDLAARRHQPQQFAIAKPDEFLARRQARKEVVQMGVGIGQPALGVEGGDSHTQGIEQRQQGGLGARFRQGDARGFGSRHRRSCGMALRGPKAPVCALPVSDWLGQKALDWLPIRDRNWPPFKLH